MNNEPVLFGQTFITKVKNVKSYLKKSSKTRVIASIHETRNQNRKVVDTTIFALIVVSLIK